MDVSLGVGVPQAGNAVQGVRIQPCLKVADSEEEHWEEEVVIDVHHATHCRMETKNHALVTMLAIAVLNRHCLTFCKNEDLTIAW